LNGFGLQNPKLAGYGGNPADCLACLDKKCGKCYKYYKKCLEVRKEKMQYALYYIHRPL
jgi:hypothetical protein